MSNGRRVKALSVGFIASLGVAPPAAANPTSYNCRAELGGAKVERRILPDGQIVFTRGEWQSRHSADGFRYFLLWSGATDDPFEADVKLWVKLPHKLDVSVRQKRARIEVLSPSDEAHGKSSFATPFWKDSSAPFSAAIPWKWIDGTARTGGGLILNLVDKKKVILAHDLLSTEYVNEIRKSIHGVQAMMIDQSKSPKGKCEPHFGAPDDSDIILT